MAKRAILLAVLLLSFVSIEACSKGGGGGSSPTGPTNNTVSPEVLALLREVFTGGIPGTPAFRFPSAAITYRVEGGDEAAQIIADQAADFWNRNAGMMLMRAPAGTNPQIAVRLDRPSGGPCQTFNSSDTSTATFTRAEVVGPPICLNVQPLVHEFGHAIGIRGHAHCGIMGGDNPKGPVCSGGGLTEGPAGLFQAVRVLYSSPPGTKF